MKFDHFIYSNTIRAFFVLCFASFLGLASVSAQDTPPIDTDEQEQKDETEERKEGKEINIPGHHEKGRLFTNWLGLSAGINGYASGGRLNLPNSLDQLELRYGRSLEWNLHLLNQRLDLHKKRFVLEYGLDLNFNIYSFVNNISLKPGEEEVTIIEENLDFKRNKLRTTSLNVPLLLTFVSKKGPNDNVFHFSAGAYGSVLLGAKQKLKIKDGEKRKVRDDFNLNAFNYGLTARIGGGPVTFYAKYSLTSLFKENQGPNLIPFSFGIVILDNSYSDYVK